MCVNIVNYPSLTAKCKYVKATEIIVAIKNYIHTHIKNLKEPPTYMFLIFPFINKVEFEIYFAFFS